jgi:hypothetical protein
MAGPPRRRPEVVEVSEPDVMQTTRQAAPEAAGTPEDRAELVGHQR